MGKTYDELNDKLRKFILEQRMFFVGSAPTSEDGHVNISPKGSELFRVLDSKTVAYLDLTGSGVESIAHIKENKRFVIMFCSYDKHPLIVRLHGQGAVIERADEEWPELSKLFPETKIARAIIKLAIERVGSSCGWGVPKYEYVGERDQYSKYAAGLDDKKLRRDQKRDNMKSVDGLPGLDRTSV